MIIECNLLSRTHLDLVLVAQLIVVCSNFEFVHYSSFVRLDSANKVKAFVLGNEVNELLSNKVHHQSVFNNLCLQHLLHVNSFSFKLEISGCCRFSGSLGVQLIRQDPKEAVLIW